MALNHLKFIFDKTGTRTGGELVASVFLREYVPALEIAQNY